MTVSSHDPRSTATPAAHQDFRVETGARGIPVGIRNVHREFAGGVVAIENLTLEIAAGEFVAILGPSGCGKSTLLRLIAGLDRADRGEIALHAPQADQSDRRREYAARGRGSAGRRAIAYVFQDAHLLPWRNVLRNVALPLELMHVGRRERLAAAREAIAQVGLADAASRYPAQLSGGMRMRVSLARALVTNPRLLLLDEPFAALDEITRAHLDLQLRELWQSRGMTVLFVTHSITEAAFLADRAIVLTRRPARTVIDHAIDLPPRRTNELRGDAAFARQTRVLLDALERGGA
jgi:NitT/TauT family transport system ATP-binding protein